MASQRGTDPSYGDPLPWRPAGVLLIFGGRGPVDTDSEPTGISIPLQIGRLAKLLLPSFA
jgi:hypothetical protein